MSKEKVRGPYIVFRRTMNKGLADKKAIFLNGINKGKEYVSQRGEYEEDYRRELCDENGELHSFATQLGILQYISKGYQPIEYGGFDVYYDTHSPSHHRYDELLLIEKDIAKRVATNKELFAARAELAKAKKPSKAKPKVEEAKDDE